MVGSTPLGRGTFTIIAGPCAVESEEQAMIATRAAKAAGATILRGDIYKPRTSPYSFQGLGERGLEILMECRRDTGLPIIIEVVDVSQVAHVAEVADCIRVGTRNAQNFELLKEVGLTKKPVMLKRGLAMTIDEWLQAAEYVAQRGNAEIILCERGIRTFEPATRNTLDLAGMAVAQHESHLPVIVDPSHAVGKKHLVAPMARAAVAAGADARDDRRAPRSGDRRCATGRRRSCPRRWRRWARSWRRSPRRWGVRSTDRRSGAVRGLASVRATTGGTRAAEVEGPSRAPRSRDASDERCSAERRIC